MTKKEKLPFDFKCRAVLGFDKIYYEIILLLNDVDQPSATLQFDSLPELIEVAAHFRKWMGGSDV